LPAVQPSWALQGQAPVAPGRRCMVCPGKGWIVTKQATPDDFTDLSADDAPEPYLKPLSRQTFVPPPSSHSDSASTGASPADPRRRPMGVSPLLAAERNESGPRTAASFSVSGSSVSRAMKIAMKMREKWERRDAGYLYGAPGGNAEALEKKQSSWKAEYCGR
jgi:hypothetical protein